MLRLFRSARWLFAAGFVVLGLSMAMGEDRSVVRLQGVDLPGADYETLKGVDLDACEAACTEDRACRAFTFNQQAKWCFLKAAAGPQAPFPDATSGTIAASPSYAQIEAARQAELPFPADGIIESARTFASALSASDPAPQGITYADLVAAGDAALAQANAAGAMVSYRQALGISGNDPALWLKLADTALGRAEIERNAGNGTYDLAQIATTGAVNAFLRSDSATDRAAALGRLARALEYREMWREAIASYRTGLGLVDDAGLQQRLDQAVAEHGFRITSHEVDAEAASPRICAVFSEPLPSAETDLSAYVVVDSAPQIAVETADSQICLTGLAHGSRYALKFRAGLPAASGESLLRDVALDVYVPDRTPFVGFANNAYLMPAGLGGGLPITSVNADKADLMFYRIGDRAMATAVRNGIFQRTLDGYSAEDVANIWGEKIWEGQVDLTGAAPNEMSVTAIPVGEVLEGMAPGAYVVTAKVNGQQTDYWREMATQWFIVSDLGLTTVGGEDGVNAFVRSLTTAQPVSGASVRLVAANNEILGEGTTDADGRFTFAPGLARGEGGRSPQLLVVETEAGDYAFLDVSRSAFDLTDRGVEGRPSPGPLDMFATTERGVYRPGETVFVTALLRDSDVVAVADLPLTLTLQRPDGVIASTELLSDAGAGSYFAALPLVEEAMRGSWSIHLYSDPKDAALTTLTFLVEDFEPERLAFTVSAPDAPIVPGEVTEVSVAASYLYGATAPNLNVEADSILRPTTTLAGHPGYTFGRLDDTFETYREQLGVVGTTDENGDALAEVVIYEPTPTTRPLEAQLILRLVDSNGRTVERSLNRPVRASGDRLGLRPQFESGEGLAEGSEALFDLIAVDPDGALADLSGVKWTLSRVETSYQWYRQYDGWRWEAITTTREVANGTVDATASGPVTIGAAVQWGLYRLEVETSGEGATSSSTEFYAGYYYPSAGSDTPDTLSVVLDRDAYRPGDVANLRLDPQFAGTALVMVVDDQIVDMQAVEVPAEGTTVPIPVTEAWGPGAYVTAILYRPGDAAEKRMPARALGVAYADVDPGEQELDVTITAPDEQRARQTMEVSVDLGAAVAGQPAYVAVAAVDLGILNLTSFPVPDPDGWYFGQRQLGVEIRDLYGNLIDPTQGMPGALSVGGDGGATRTGTPPSISVLVAMHSGIVAVGADGKASVSFDMPDFNGTVRLMAMAWTDNAVGHASKDVIVRDPVVVSLSPPRFLRVGDTSRLLVEIDNVAGRAGTYGLTLTTGEGIVAAEPESSVELAEGARTNVEFALSGTLAGDYPVRLIITSPGGEALVKQLTLGVREASGPRTTASLVTIEPGGTAVLDAAYFANVAPHTGMLTAAVGPIARLDVPGLLWQLDRYPYGCAEQTASRALPLLYLNEVAQMIGLGTDEELAQRIRTAISDLLAKQNSAGGFGLWGPFSYSDLWLDAYVTEFLLRAKDEGYDVPETALTMALDNLANQLAYATDFSNGGEDVAYGLYTLARAGRVAIGDLRYYLEARLDAFGSPLAKAQLGAALALYGDRARAGTAFAAALADLEKPEDRKVYRADYGSKLRDIAAILALAAEVDPPGVDLAALAEDLATLRDLARYTSTQEDAWTLLAAAALARDAGDGSISVDGAPLTGSVYLSYEQEHFDGGPVTIVNTGNTATVMKVSVTGIPAEPPPAQSEGFLIRRAYYLPDGTPADLANVSQNDRFVVVLTMGATTLGSGQYVVADPLPGGFEIENPDLSQGAGVADLSWLRLDTPAHVESRTDQYVAAFRYVSETTEFSTAYMVRAVSPGAFVLPGATVEDMYRPELRGNTAADRITVTAAGP